MKRFLISCMAVFMACSSMNAQSDNGMLNHLSIGVNAGTPGVGVDLAVPVLGDLLSVRVGYAFVPKVTGNTTLDMSGKIPTEVSNYYTGKTYDIPQQIDVEGKISMANAKVLADVYPFKHCAFHLTAGAYIGGGDVVTLTNKTPLTSLYEANQDIMEYNKKVAAGEIPGASQQKLLGVQLGDYLLTADKNGKVDGVIRASGFKPYLGLGWGNAVPKKAVGLMVEAGCMFWGNPQVFSNGEELTSENIGGEGGDIIKTISKISVYPVINLRLCFKAL